MSALTLTINAADLRRIRGKLAKIQASFLDADGVTLKYLVRLTDEYCETIASGMGTVYAGDGVIGGEYATDTLRSPFLGDSVTVHWKELAPQTLRYKKALGLSTNIWMATGETKSSVAPWVKVFSKSASLFGGIDGSLHPDAYKKALAVETGAGEEHTWEARALFARVNEIFVKHHTEIVDGIQREIHDMIEKSGW